MFKSMGEPVLPGSTIATSVPSATTCEAGRMAAAAPDVLSATTAEGYSVSV